MKTSDKILLFLAEYLGAILIWLLGKSLRLKFPNGEVREAITSNVIYAFWHNRMLVLAYTHRNQRINVLVSQHKDGELIARPLHRLGFTTSRGSTTRGGIRALFNMAKRCVRENVDVAITPDGPKGPRYQAQIGAILLARRTTFPILPIAWNTEGKWQLNSWDGFMIPKPFSKGVVLWGDPIYVSKQDDLDEKLRELQSKLDAVTETVDGYFETEMFIDKES
jgi:hypothetical protein